jgi:hypothetical protein
MAGEREVTNEAFELGDRARDRKSGLVGMVSELLPDDEVEVQLDAGQVFAEQLVTRKHDYDTLVVRAEDLEHLDGDVK